MTVSIAMAGKGGTGKTTLAALVIRALVKRGLGPVLAVDADPASSLGLSLGLTLERTIGSVLAEFNIEKMSIPAGFTKESYLDFRLNETIVESRDVDLITMGRGEGAGCYCFPNNVLRHFIDRLSANYRYLVLDNEAGLEHIARGTTGPADHLILVSNPSIKGVRTLESIMGLIRDIGLSIDDTQVVINMSNEEPEPRVTAEMSRMGIRPDMTVPFDQAIMDFDWEQKTLLEMPGESPAAAAVDRLVSKILPSS
ncbi:Cobyrinic acid ac-diamide synthase [Dehalogenimonas lykanthroporepellens BL-DC-9]|nr:Cobyrinic acid ac-diamide synthase [Dehalogenimonas lykanthroporepellens BL-DC-9]